MAQISHIEPQSDLYGLAFEVKATTHVSQKHLTGLAYLSEEKIVEMII